MKHENYEDLENLLLTSNGRSSKKQNEAVGLSTSASKLNMDTNHGAASRHFCSMQRIAIPSLIFNVILFVYTNCIITRSVDSATIKWLKIPPTAAAATSSTSSYTIEEKKLNATIGYVPHGKIFGHLHVAKTAGTEINGELAAHYERVCGHKGYSYDAVQFNKRVQKVVDTKGSAHMTLPTADIISTQYKDRNRGRVPPDVMVEIGYEDCDYISLEEPWHKWTSSVLPLWPVELHVPCREPLSHLMSQCNHRSKSFKCDNTMTDEALAKQIAACLLFPNRFSRNLTGVENLTLKCFNPFPLESYLEYMDQFLQRKRIESKYVHRESNYRTRKKAQECIWKDKPFANRVLNALLSQYDYYSWCQDCMGNEDDLLLGWAGPDAGKGNQ